MMTTTYPYYLTTDAAEDKRSTAVLSRPFQRRRSRSNVLQLIANGFINYLFDGPNLPYLWRSSDVNCPSRQVLGPTAHFDSMRMSSPSGPPMGNEGFQIGPPTYESRREYLENLISEVPPAGRVLMVGTEQCSILRELYDEGSVRPDIFFHCIDDHQEAIDKAILLLGGRTNRCMIQKVDVLRFWTSDAYDLIWSDGVFDALDEATSRRLLLRLNGFLGPKGQIVLGSFAVTKEASSTQVGQEIGRATQERLGKLRDAVFKETPSSIDCSLLNIGTETALFLAFNILSNEPSKSD